MLKAADDHAWRAAVLERGPAHARTAHTWDHVTERLRTLL
jgi:hypothetical protein